MPVSGKRTNKPKVNEKSPLKNKANVNVCEILQEIIVMTCTSNCFRNSSTNLIYFLTTKTSIYFQK